MSITHFHNDRLSRRATLLDSVIDRIAPCPWPAHVGAPTRRAPATPHKSSAAPLYTAEERARRDASKWTIVQAVLAPLQFAAFALSAILVWRFLTSGEGYALATGSILIKSGLLYAIMITGAIWEKEVFGKWLFAKPFFWEDVFSMLVIALHTAYIASLFGDWATPRQQMLIAIAAYASYVINAGQFLLKLRAARLEGAQRAAHNHSGPAVGRPA
jgi:3-vinyl bacteriochlorophyllide hydratase